MKYNKFKPVQFFKSDICFKLKFNFCTTQINYNKKHLNQPTDYFQRRIKLSVHLGPNNENKKQIEEDNFKTPSNKNWQPENTNHTIETFIVLTSTEVCIEKTKYNKT